MSRAAWRAARAVVLLGAVAGPACSLLVDTGDLAGAGSDGGAVDALVTPTSEAASDVGVADAAAEAATACGDAGALVFEDDFEVRALGEGWSRRVETAGPLALFDAGTPNRMTVLRASSLASGREDKGSALFKVLPARDHLIVSFDLRVARSNADGVGDLPTVYFVPPPVGFTLYSVGLLAQSTGVGLHAYTDRPIDDGFGVDFGKSHHMTLEIRTRAPSFARALLDGVEVGKIELPTIVSRGEELGVGMPHGHDQTTTWTVDVDRVLVCAP